MSIGLCDMIIPEGKADRLLPLDPRSKREKKHRKGLITKGAV